MSPPRPASSDTIYIIHTSGSVNNWMSMLPASTANLSGLVTLTLKVVSESRVTWAISVSILVFLGVSVLDLDPMYVRDRQTSDRQTSDSIIT